MTGPLSDKRCVGALAGTSVAARPASHLISGFSILGCVRASAVDAPWHGLRLDAKYVESVAAAPERLS